MRKCEKVEFVCFILKSGKCVEGKRKVCGSICGKLRLLLEQKKWTVETVELGLPGIV